MPGGACAHGPAAFNVFLMLLGPALIRRDGPEGVCWRHELDSSPRLRASLPALPPIGGGVMSDVLFLGAVILFFVLSALYAAGCEKLR